jgi:hypothetical protein
MTSPEPQPLPPDPNPDPIEPEDPDQRPQAAAIDPELPILVQPVPTPKWPKVIGTVQALTGLQVALVMLCGNCSYGWALVGAFSWVAEYFDLAVDPFSFGVYSAWAVGFAAIFTYACFTSRWAGRADRRARTTILIGTAVLVGFTAVTIAFMGVGDPQFTKIILIAAAPSLIIQAVVLQCVYGREGSRWFNSSETTQPDGSAEPDGSGLGNGDNPA